MCGSCWQLTDSFWEKKKTSHTVLYGVLLGPSHFFLFSGGENTKLQRPKTKTRNTKKKNNDENTSTMTNI